jgi:signal transduction histidine kinase
LTTVGAGSATGHGVGGVEERAGRAEQVVRERGQHDPGGVGQNPPLLTAQITSTTYRIVQESLTNVLRHAGPVPTQVGVEFDPGQVTIEVHNSPGLLPLNHQAHGHGLLGMHERVLECGGELTSGPDLLGGFAVKAVLPVTAA